jgi:hypothetical protein
MFAHYTATKVRKTVTITCVPTLSHSLIWHQGVECQNRVAEIVVSGKVEARKVAAEHGARCWNF